MIAGILEIQLMANMARLSDDMRRAEQVVTGSMTKVEKSVASAKTAMSQLGMGVSIGLMADTLRRTVDSYTKLDAQLRLSTKSQEQYNQALSDIRTISTVAQSDISATTMLYTRLMNVMDGTGVSQEKLNLVTQTVSFGLKAYGATAQEAASASLQLSQAMGANRLGGEEFRAVMEAMPNVMKVLAKSMGVPLGELRALSIAGKITADEMVKAWGNPEIAAQFRKMAESAQTVTGAWTVARNELMLLVGEFSKTSGITGSAITAFKGIGEAVKFLADNIGVLLNALYAYVTVIGGRFVIGLLAARAAQANLNAAHAEALVMNVALARNKMALANANMTLAASTAELAAAEKLHAAGTVSIVGRIKGLVGRAGWIGMALFGVWTVVDFLTGMQAISDGAKKTVDDMSNMTLVQMQLLRNAKALELALMKRSMFSGLYETDIKLAEQSLRVMDAQIARTVALANAETKVAAVKKVTAPRKAKPDTLAERMSGLAAEMRAQNENADAQISNVQRIQLAFEKGIREKKVTEQAAFRFLDALNEASIKDQNAAKLKGEKDAIEQRKAMQAQRAESAGIRAETAGIAGQNALFGLTGEARIAAELEQAKKVEDARYEADLLAQARRIQTMIDENTWKQDTATQQATIMEDLERQHQARLTQIQNTHLTARQQFERMTMIQQVDFISNALMQATAAGARENRTLFEINKAAGIANAIVSTYTGATKALELGPWGIPLAAVITAAGLANVAAIASTTFGSGAGAGAAAGGAAAGIPSMASTAPTVTPTAPTAIAAPVAEPRQVNIYMRGDEVYGAKAVREQLIPALNDALGDGVVINVRAI